MKQLLLLLFLAVPSFAAQKYDYADPKIDDEFTNNYREHRFPAWVIAKGSTATITYLNVSSLTVNGRNFTGSSAGGSNTQIQYNNAGSAGGVTGFTFSGSTLTYTGTTFGATKFTDTLGRSIYGNLVASNTVTSGSSVTVNVSGYTDYVVRLYMVNATGSAGSVFVRVNNDNSTSYSYSNDGFLNTVSTGSACANVAAKQFLLTGVNVFNNGVRATATFNITLQSVNFMNGSTIYQETTGNNTANMSNAGYANIGSLTSIQAWVGQMQSCTIATDPLTGTTGSILVWGVF